MDHFKELEGPLKALFAENSAIIRIIGILAISLCILGITGWFMM